MAKSTDTSEHSRAFFVDDDARFVYIEGVERVMEHPEYRGFTIRHRLLVDDLPLLVLERHDERICVSEGRYKLIVEFLQNISCSAREWLERPEDFVEDINYILHRGFVTEEGWAEGQGTFYGHLIQPEEFAEWACDDDFTAELERYRQRTGKSPGEPFWHVAVNSGSWRGAARNLPKSSVQKMLDVTRRVLVGALVFPENLESELRDANRVVLFDGVEVLSDEEWDVRFGWAACTGLRMSVLQRLETLATDYLEALRDKAFDLEEKRAGLLNGLSGANLLHRELSDGVFYQLDELGYGNLRTCVDDPESVFLLEGKS